MLGYHVVFGEGELFLWYVVLLGSQCDQIGIGPQSHGDILGGGLKE
jgi:hypothetical protein